MTEYDPDSTATSESSIGADNTLEIVKIACATCAVVIIAIVITVAVVTVVVCIIRRGRKQDRHHLPANQPAAFRNQEFPLRETNVHNNAIPPWQNVLADDNDRYAWIEANPSVQNSINCNEEEDHNCCARPNVPGQRSDCKCN